MGMNMEFIKKDDYSGELDYRAFGSMLDHPTQCYKFYWLEAIMNLMLKKHRFSFDEIFDEMIVSAWYTVTQYHLFLGPMIEGERRDAINRAIDVLVENTSLNENSKPDEIRSVLKEQNYLVLEYKRKLAKNVPYKLLSSFSSELTQDKGDAYRIEYIQILNQEIHLPYIIENGVGIGKCVVLQEAWIPFLMDNYLIIKNWIQYNKIQFLQMINPGVPGIINKLDDERNNVRHLERVRDLWNAHIEVSNKEIVDIYTGNKLESTFDVDHFIPWSYVAHDEMWNLIPSNASANRSKSNHLPEWDLYFNKMANMEYDLYKSVVEYDSIHKLFEKCYAKNLQSLWAIEELYVKENTEYEFKHKLEAHMYPLYEAARMQGYIEWRI